MMTFHESTTLATVVRKASRWAMGAAGVLWVALAASLCGCSPISPVNGWVMNESGQAYYKRGDYRSARREFERALMDRPESADYAFNVAAAMDREGDKLAAEKMYRHALTLDPSHQPSYHGLAAMMHETGRTTEANDLLNTWAATQPYMAEPHVELGWLKQEQGDMEGADRALTRALRNNPRHSKALAQLGKVKGRRGRNDEAAADYARSLFMDPQQAEVRQDLASMGYDSSMSPALQMATMMPQYDPTMAGGFPAGSYSPTTSYAMPPTPSLAQQSMPMTSTGYGMSNYGAASYSPMNYGAPQYNTSAYGATNYGTPSYSPAGTPAYGTPTYNPPMSAPMMNSPMMSSPASYSPTTYNTPSYSPQAMTTSPIPTPAGMVYPGAVSDPIASTYMTGTAPYGASMPQYSSNVPQQYGAGQWQTQYQPMPNTQFTPKYSAAPVASMGMNDAPTWSPEANGGMPTMIGTPIMNTGFSSGSAPVQTSTLPVVPAF